MTKPEHKCVFDPKIMDQYQVCECGAAYRRSKDKNGVEWDECLSAEYMALMRKKTEEAKNYLADKCSEDFFS